MFAEMILKKQIWICAPLTREQLELMQQDYALTSMERLLVETALYYENEIAKTKNG